jgi:hypothetical protein
MDRLNSFSYVRMEEADAGFYTNRFVFDFDTDVFGDLHSYLKVVDEFRESSHRCGIRECLDTENICS